MKVGHEFENHLESGVFCVYKYPIFVYFCWISWVVTGNNLPGFFPQIFQVVTKKTLGCFFRRLRR